MDSGSPLIMQQQNYHNMDSGSPSKMRKTTGTPIRVSLSIFVCCCTLVSLLSARDSGKLTALQIRTVIDEKRAEKPRSLEVIPPKNETHPASANHRSKSAKRPPLESIVHESIIVGDPQFLLDFAILGFAKCGTSTMMTWIGQHPAAQCIQEEVYDLIKDKPAELIRRLYNELPEGDYKRGYKSPGEIGQAHVRAHISRYWPLTPIFVGIRHPVTWFESFYNFRANNIHGIMPHANKLVGKCTRGKMLVCTDRALFHVELASLGKTNMTSPEELEMIQRHPKQLKKLPPRFSNKIFLFTTDQLADKNTTRMELFRKDVQHVIGFTQEMPPMVHVKPGVKWDNKTQALKDSKKIDICDSEYDKLRAVLMGIARPASIWIRKYFIESGDEVVVSSPDYFKETLETWMHDPCDSRPANTE